MSVDAKSCCVNTLHYAGLVLLVSCQLISTLAFWMQLARQAYNEALGKGIWLDFSEGTRSAVSGVPNEENQLFSSLEEEGVLIEVPAEKVTLLFNLARLHEQLHETGKATVLYQLILFKVHFFLSFSSGVYFATGHIHEYAEIYAFCALSRVQCIHTVPLSEFW